MFLGWRAGGGVIGKNEDIGLGPNLSFSVNNGGFRMKIQNTGKLKKISGWIKLVSIKISGSNYNAVYILSTDVMDSQVNGDQVRL